VVEKEEKEREEINKKSSPEKVKLKCNLILFCEMNFLTKF
jgi:hypothetical protein